MVEKKNWIPLLILISCSLFCVYGQTTDVLGTVSRYTSGSLSNPVGIVADLHARRSFGVYISDFANNCIRFLAFANNATTITVNSATIAGYSGEGGDPTLARIFGPRGISVLPNSGSYCFADSQNHRVRCVNRTGVPVIHTIVGTGVAASSPDGGIGSSTAIHNPVSVAFAPTTNALGQVLIYIAEAGSGSKIRVYNFGSGFVSSLSSFYNPEGLASLAFDFAGNLFVSETATHVIRKINLLTSQVTTVAGVANTFGLGANNVLATSSLLNSPQGIVVDRFGNLIFAETDNNRIRFISPNGVIKTLAGSGVAGMQDGNGTNSSFNKPFGLTFDANGNLLVTDTINNAVRFISLQYPSQTSPSNQFSCGASLPSGYQETFDSNFFSRWTRVTGAPVLQASDSIQLIDNSLIRFSSPIFSQSTEILVKVRLNSFTPSIRNFALGFGAGNSNYDLIFLFGAENFGAQQPNGSNFLNEEVA